MFLAFSTSQLKPYKLFRKAEGGGKIVEYAMSTGTSNLLRHIKAQHMDVWHAKAKVHGWKNLDSQTSTNAASNIASLGRVREEFDVEKFHEQLAKFIVADDQVSQFCAPNISFSHCFITPVH